MSFIMRISRSMPMRCLSALVAAAASDRRDALKSLAGMILAAAILPVRVCRAILTRPAESRDE